MEEMQAESAKEVLIAAKWILENVGWCQGAFYRDADGKRIDNPVGENRVDTICQACSLGAIHLVKVDDPQHRWDAMDLLQRAIDEKTGESELIVDIAGFNDVICQRKEDVVDIFSIAINHA